MTRYEVFSVIGAIIAVSGFPISLLGFQIGVYMMAGGFFLILVAIGFILNEYIKGNF